MNAYRLEDHRLEKMAQQTETNSRPTILQHFIKRTKAVSALPPLIAVGSEPDGLIRALGSLWLKGIV